ncbi:branched-chain amino acid permease [Neisseria meningitidis]|nr:branched-chain amino acid permease [Neisseria meningitidis]
MKNRRCVLQRLFFLCNFIAGWCKTSMVLPCLDSEFCYSGLTKTSTALPRLSSKRTIL